MSVKFRNNVIIQCNWKLKALTHTSISLKWKHACPRRIAKLVTGLVVNVVQIANGSAKAGPPMLYYTQ